MGMKPSTQTSAGLVQQFDNSALQLIQEIHDKLPAIADLSTKLAALGDFNINAISHNSLLNRNVADTHPISAITGLAAILATIPQPYNDAPLLSAINNLTLNKVSVAVGMGLSQNSFTDAYKLQLDNLNTLLAGKANVSHTHNQSDIVGLSSALANKQDSLVSGTTIKTINGVSVLGSGDIVINSGTVDHSTLTNRNLADAHTIASITGLSTALAGKSDVGHTHSLAISDITNLQTTLNGKASTAVVTTTVDGLMAFADKVKLNGIATGATANSTDATLLNRANHTGSQAISTVTNLQTTLDGKQATLVSGTNIKTINGVSVLGSGDIVISGGGGGTTDHSALTNRSLADAHPISAITGLQTALDSKAGTAVATTTVSGLMSNTDKSKLDGIAAGATVNSTDAALRDRSTHTGTQAISTVTGLQTTLDGKAATTHTHAIADVTGLQTALDSKATPANITSALTGYVKIHIGTTAPADTTMLWLDTN